MHEITSPQSIPS